MLGPAGYALLVMSSNHDPSIDAANVRHLNSRRLDSFLVAPSGEDDRALPAGLSDFEGPVVALESELKTDLTIDSVYADHRAGTRTAITHLLGLGHRRIAALTGAATWRSGRERMAGLLKGLSARGRDDRALPLATEHRAEAAEEAVLQALDSAAPSTALLACSPPLLVGALRPIERRELAVGRDLALVGWDGGPLVQLAQPPIAVVDRNPRSLGAAASALALKRLGHGGARDDGPARVEILATAFIPHPPCVAIRLRQAPARREKLSTRGG